MYLPLNFHPSLSISARFINNQTYWKHCKCDIVQQQTCDNLYDIFVINTLLTGQDFVSIRR
jgi:hypothetical protein